MARLDFELRAVHLPGVENRVADWLSRWDCHENYRNLFNEFIGDEIGEYNEICISPDLFSFSGET